MNENTARAVLKWQYEPPYDFYNNSELEELSSLQHLLNPRNAFYSLEETDSLVAFCSFGPDGQVTGGDYQDQALDIGMGVRPDLTGCGNGNRFATAVLEFADSLFAPAAFRVTIAAFNQRAIRVWQKLGFEQQQSFKRNDGVSFIVLMRTHFGPPG
nr:GNAT family N-acetyltransferase [Leptolyngbya sp. FACHB-36]